VNAPDKTVLIAEDSPVQAELLRRVLAEAGYAVIVARDGAEALAKAKASRPVALVSDINMPEMDGYALCRAIRQDEDLKLTPVMLLTMLTEPLDVIRGLNAGADAYVTKPYNAPMLLSRLDSLLAFPPAPPPDRERRKAQIRIAGETHVVDAHGPRMLNLLVSTYENAVLQNRDLVATQKALEDFNAHLEDKVQEKTAALLESEQRFRALIENASDLVVVVDAKGVVTYASPSIRRLGGYEPAEVLGREFLDLTHPEDRPAAAASLGRILNQPDSLLTTEFRYVVKDGSQVTLEAIARNALADPSVRGIVVNARDVTERRRAAEALRRSLDLLSTVVENIPARVFWKDSDLRYLGCNTAFARDAGRKRSEELLGKDDFEMGWRDQAERYRADDRRVIESDVPKLGIEEPQSTPEGRTIWLRTSKVPLHDAGGTVLGVLGIYEDITERKNAERSLARANRALRTLSAGNLSLVRATDEQALLAEMCRVVVEVGGYGMAVVGYAHDDDEKSVEPMACHGVDLSSLKRSRLSWKDEGLGGGAFGGAIRSRAPQIVRHAEKDPRQAPWVGALVAAGVWSGAGAGAWSELALPLSFDSQKPFGVLLISATEVDVCDEAEVKLLVELAGDLAFGVQTLRTRAERRAAGDTLRRSLEDSIQTIAATVEMRDPYTAGHQRRVATLAEAIALEMGLAEERVHGLRLAGTIHDLGKIGVPAEILAKPTRLSAIEFHLVQQHPQAGYDILKDVSFPWPIARMVLEHHERLDGTGYPRGLKGEAILLESRILAVADVIEAMSSHRPYRAGLGLDAALQEIQDKRGSAFDPEVVDACLRLFREKGFALTT
jgi:PAS domain S-box-containing protein